jgi:hypothetical protein
MYMSNEASLVRMVVDGMHHVHINMLAFTYSSSATIRQPNVERTNLNRNPPMEERVTVGDKNYYRPQMARNGICKQPCSHRGVPADGELRRDWPIR